MLILLLIKFYLISFDSLCLTKDLKEVINETEDKLNSDFNPTSERLSQNQKIFNIGAVLSSEESIGHFLQAIDDLNYETEILTTDIKVHGVALPKDQNPIKNTLNICEKLLSSEVYGVVVDDTNPSITYTTTFHNIPTIGISNREAVLSDRSMYATFVRSVPSYSNQADVWVELLNYFNFSCVVTIHSNDINGRSVQNRFEMLADGSNIKLETTIEYEMGFPDITRHLEETKQSSTCRVFTVYTNREDSEAIFQQIINLNMSASGYVWIASEQALAAKNRPTGVLALKLENFDNSEGHIRDSVYIIGMALKEMVSNNNVTKPPTDCRDLSRPKWKSGSLLFSLIKNLRLPNGKTGFLSFDERGDRINSNYTIINVANDQVNQDVGRFSFSDSDAKKSLILNESKIVWSGNNMNKPIGYEVPNHFRVATIAEKPFIWVNPANDDGQCPPEEIPCPKVDQKTGIEHKFCCTGYCMDLLKTLAAQLNFTYSVHQVQDGLYGGFSFVNGSNRKVWTGLVGELYYKRADMVVAPLTINPERSLAIEFTKPFKYQGIQILQKKQSIHRLRHPLASFLQPFQNGLWVSVFVSVHVVALALYLLDRFSPFGRYKLPNCDVTEEDALNLSSAIWFAWGVLLNSGIGEGTPRSFSGRVLGMVWAGFAMIVVASYTANLAAFLVLDRPETPLTGINDPRLRSPVEGFNYSTVRDSSVDMYFRRQVELTHMYRRMRDVIYDNAEDAIAAVKSGDLNAFIWDSARLDYEAHKDCELSTSGELFGRSGYAIGMTKGNHFWSTKVTFALLGLHEMSYMEDLDNKWIVLQELCEEKSENFPATLGLKNMAGVFILVGIGILAGIGLIMFEIAYKKRSTSKQKRIDLARNAIDKWKEVIEKRRAMVENLNQNAKQRYYQKHHQFKYHNTKNEETTSRSVDTMPFTVEKGINAISVGTSQTTQERRPKLKRGFSIGSDTDLDVLPAESQPQTEKRDASEPKATKCGTSYDSANTNYMSLV